MKHTLALVTCFLLMGVAAGTSHAVVLVSNLSASPGLNGIIGTSTSNPSLVFVKTVSFTMPSTSYVLDDVVLRLFDSSPLDGVPVVSIRGDAAGVPGSVLATLAGPSPSLTSSQQNVSFTPASTITLDANTTYWLHVGNTGSGEFRWLQSDPDTDPAGVASFGTQLNSNNGGASWFGNSARNMLQINASAVPEPSRLLLTFLGIGAVMFRRRR